jgi:phage terminase large subunit
MHDNNWFLVNMLAGLSVGSGNVFQAKQLKMFDFSAFPNLKFEETRMGVDLGFSVARDPTATVVLGIANGKAWVKHYEEVNIDSFPDLTEHLIEIAQEHRVERMFFDPSASSRPYISYMNSKDYDAPLVSDFMPTKEERVANIINVVERRKIYFDDDCERLVNILKALHYLKGTRDIAKVNDHGFDALTYALCDLDLGFFEDDSAGPDIRDTPKPDYEKTMRDFQIMMESSPEEKKPQDYKIRGLDD